MKVGNTRGKRKKMVLSADLPSSVELIPRLDKAIRSLNVRNGHVKVLLSGGMEDFNKIREIGAKLSGDVVVEYVRVKKVLKTGRRLAKDARFSRAAQLIRQDESRETTAGIAQKFDETLKDNKAFYDALLPEFKT